MAFSYKSIPVGHIRLLKPAGPRPTTINSTLAFTVHEFPIHTAPPYTAISYVCGTGAASQTIKLDGYDLAVRQTLWSCLYYLLQLWTHPYHHVQWEYIWADAICIDQSDGKEKNEQVRAMGKVFSTAVEVTAWLGLQRLPQYVQWREQAAKTIENEDWDLSENIIDIAERPYWSRTWIVQELLLAKQIRLHVSGVSFDFHELAHHVTNNEASNTEDLRRILAYTKARDVDNIGNPQPLLDILLQFGACQCSDPRDNIFAVMSLLNHQDKQVLGRYFPDYTLTHDAVVAITLSYLRDYCGHRDRISHDSKEVLDSLGVSPSRQVRRRLIAASEAIDVCCDAQLISSADFIEIPYFVPEYTSSRRQTHSEGWKVSFGNTIGRLWWFATCFGLLQRERDPYQQALENLMAQMEEHRRIAQHL
jgi:hypothetical protein